MTDAFRDWWTAHRFEFYLDCIGIAVCVAAIAGYVLWDWWKFRREWRLKGMGK